MYSLDEEARMYLENKKRQAVIEALARKLLTVERSKDIYEEHLRQYNNLASKSVDDAYFFACDGDFIGPKWR
jgi:hypothetical protein